MVTTGVASEIKSLLSSLATTACIIGVRLANDCHAYFGDEISTVARTWKWLIDILPGTASPSTGEIPVCLLLEFVVSGVNIGLSAKAGATAFYTENCGPLVLPPHRDGIA